MTSTSAEPTRCRSVVSVAGLAAVVFGYSPLLWMGAWFADASFPRPVAPALEVDRDVGWLAENVQASPSTPTNSRAAAPPARFAPMVDAEGP